MLVDKMLSGTLPFLIVRWKAQEAMHDISINYACVILMCILIDTMLRGHKTYCYFNKPGNKNAFSSNGLKLHA